ncbi:MAG: reverse transcriptase-like protein [Sphaerospermopsis sp. SIO1G2]|nr:reverse transcriptase-like protein [Sphaerospermopsis sp. SIO1G2]
MGISRVNSARLKPLHQRACQMVAHFELVHFQHIKREHNMLADALVSEAILGKTVGMPAASARLPPQSPTSIWSGLRQVLTR